MDELCREELLFDLGFFFFFLLQVAVVRFSLAETRASRNVIDDNRRDGNYYGYRDRLRGLGVVDVIDKAYLSFVDTYRL